MTICIEAKADESFGGTVAQELKNARRRPVTRFPERLDWLTRSLVGIAAFKADDLMDLSEVISDLQYQLFSGIAGTLLEAKIQRASKAIFLVHEFRTMATADSKIDANAIAMNAFLDLLQSANDRAAERLEAGRIIGPIPILQRPVTATQKIPWDIPLFVGKLRTDRRETLA